MHNYYYDHRPELPEQIPLAGRGTPPSRPPRRRGRGIWLLICFLVLIAGLTAASLLLEGSRDWSLDFLPSAQEGEAQPTPLPTQRPTTVERAPLGDGTVLTLDPLPEGAPHSYQDIYRENIASIVSVRASLGGGRSLGTGVIFSSDGYIITNSHVIEGGDRVEVVLSDERTFNALLVGKDEETDLAVLKIDARDLQPASFGDSGLLEVGDVALAIGNPLGENLMGTMTDGIISAINRDVRVEEHTMTLIQTTAALNSGNSGGALVNAFGQVVGITNLKMHSYYDTVEGLGFAIPSTTAKAVADELIAYGYVGGRPSIGIVGYTVTAEMAQAYNLPRGVAVESVEPKSDAWGKLERGDVIVEAQGGVITTMEELQALKDGLRAGDVLHLRVCRAGDYLSFDVALVERYELES